MMTNAERAAAWRERQRAKIPPEIALALAERARIRADEAEADRAALRSAREEAARRGNIMSRFNRIMRHTGAKLEAIEKHPSDAIRALMLGRLADWLSAEKQQEIIAAAKALRSAKADPKKNNASAPGKQCSEIRERLWAEGFDSLVRMGKIAGPQD